MKKIFFDIIFMLIKDWIAYKCLKQVLIKLFTRGGQTTLYCELAVDKLFEKVNNIVFK